jgi:hypothetical protein
MPTIKRYNMTNLIHVNPEGTINLEKSFEIVRKMAEAASYHKNDHILIDSRDTILQEDISTQDIFNVAMEMAKYKNVFKNKIANIVPNDTKRLKQARQFQRTIQFSGFEYKFFTDFEEAIKWLTEISPIN